MTTLVLPSRYTSDTIALWKAALQAGWGTERLQNWNPPDWLRESDPVLYGEPMFTVAVAEALGVSLLEPTLDWLVELPERYANRSVQFTTFGEIRSVDHPAFIKPADDKCFPAGVYASGLSLSEDYDLPDGIPILVSELVEWEVEYRCFISEGQVMTLSPYLRHGELVQIASGDWPAPPGELAEAEAFAAMFLDDTETRFPPAAVLDIGRIKGRGWSIVEANPAWSSGIYGCEPDQVLRVLRRACLPSEQITDQDRQWVIERRF